MNAVELLCVNIKKLKIESLLAELFNDKYFQALVVDLNTQRLFELGEDANDVRLRSRLAQFGSAYSPKTTQIKGQKGQPTDRVTLKDTGAFYKSFAFKKDNATKNFLITADVIKIDENGGVTNLQQQWGEDILGLSSENMQELIELSIEIIIPIVLEKILDV